MSKRASPIRGLLRRVIPQNYRRLLHQSFHDPGHTWSYFRRFALGHRLVVVVATPHKVGSTWLHQMLQVLGELENGIDQVPREFFTRNNTLLLKPDVFRHLHETKGYVIFKSHSLPPPPEVVGRVKIVTMYRDPRDALVSLAHYLAHLPEDQGGWGSAFAALSDTQRIATLLKQGNFLLRRLEQWFRTPIAYKAKYEDFKKDPIAQFAAAATYIGLPFNSRKLKQVVDAHSFEALSGRKPGDEQKQAFLRKGIVGDWRNYFDNKCLAAFRTGMDGRWNSLLVEMGYENSLDWA